MTNITCLIDSCEKIELNIYGALQKAMVNESNDQRIIDAVADHSIPQVLPKVQEQRQVYCPDQEGVDESVHAQLYVVSTEEDRGQGETPMC